MPDEPVRRRSFLGRNKWYILGSIGLVLFIFFRYGGVGPPVQDDDFVKVAGTEVRCLPLRNLGHHRALDT